MKEILKVNNLIKKFPKAGGEIDDADAISVLKGINFDVEQGEYVGIMGKSGCGKTTLLKILGFMDQQTDGDVIFDGVNTNELWKEELTDIRRRKIGFVFQDFNLKISCFRYCWIKRNRKNVKRKRKHWKSSLGLNIFRKRILMNCPAVSGREWQSAGR